MGAPLSTIHEQSWLLHERKDVNAVIDLEKEKERSPFLPLGRRCTVPPSDELDYLKQITARNKHAVVPALNLMLTSRSSLWPRAEITYSLHRTVDTKLVPIHLPEVAVPCRQPSASFIVNLTFSVLL